MTPDLLRAATGCTTADAQKYAPHLTAAMTRWGIDTPLRQAAFLGQICVESGALSIVSENLTYTTAARMCAVWPARFKAPADAQPYVRNPAALANLVYANRMGNGLPTSGDGYKFRGRGLKQLTGRSNYAAYKVAAGVDVLSNPDWLLQPQFAADSAGWFWHANGLSALADAGDWTGMTRKINNGLTGLADRINAIKRAMLALGV